MPPQPPRSLVTAFMRALQPAQRLLLIPILSTAPGRLAASQADDIDFTDLTDFLRQNVAPILPGGFTLTPARDGAVLYQYT